MRGIIEYVLKRNGSGLEVWYMGMYCTFVSAMVIQYGCWYQLREFYAFS